MEPGNSLNKVNNEETKHEVKETHEVNTGYDAQGRKQVNQYIFIQTVGQGQLCKVKLAHCKDNKDKLYAVKIFSKSQLRRKREYFRKKEGGMAYKDQLQNVQMEIAIMKKLQHPNLIRLHEVIDDDENDKLYMILDYAKNGEIMKWDIKTLKFTPFDQSSMHINNIVHRDIKPQNILITHNFKAKLGDFGVSQLFEKDDDDKISKTEGTYHFMAPECCDPDVESFSGKAADIWALGVTLYCMIFNKLPYWDETEFGVIQKIHKDELRISDERNISLGLKHLLLRMLEKDPQKRATIQELRVNEWLNEGCKTSLESEETSIMAEVTEDDLNFALTPIHTIVWARKFGVDPNQARNVNNPYDFNGVQQKPPPSSYQRNQIGSRAQMTTAMRGTAQQRLGTAMKSNNAVGFKSKPATNDKTGPAPPLETKKDKSEEENFKEMEEEVHRLLEQSAEAKVKRNFTEALNKAKDAASKEKKIRQLREQNNSLDQVNIDLTFYVFYNLANMYHANGLHQEALNSYTIILKNKQYPQASRLRVNMGNIYFEQQKFDQAIKMYNMALDSTMQQNKEMKMKIKKNVGLAYVKQKKFAKAIEVYEDIMNDTPDFDVGFNLIVCLYALGEKDKMRTWFERLLMIDIPGMDEEEQEELLQMQNKNLDKPVGEPDPLKEYLKEKKKEALHYVSSAAKLVAPIIEQDVIIGYNYVIEALKAANLPEVESEMEIAKSIHYIKNKEIERAIESFKAFEKKDKVMMAMASNNISFLYFLENDFKLAEQFSDLAIQHDRYNSKALVNKGNCLFINEDYDRAKEFFLEAIGVEADCIEAIYNLGLVYKRLGYYNESLQAFEKLHTIIPNSYEVIYQIAHVYELIGMRRQALKWYNILITKVPSDSEILAKMGYLYQQEQDEFQAVHYYQESYRYNPAKIDVISCLGMHHAKQDQFEKAIIYFERAFQIQPKEVKWQLMIASCYRRMNLFNEALKVYEDIHSEYPDNIDCLRGLVQIRKELGMKYQHYSEKLMILDREEEAKRMMMGGNQPGGYGQPDNYYPGGGYDMNDARQVVREAPDFSDIQPKQRKMAAGKGQRDDDDDQWGNVDALLD